MPETNHKSGFINIIGEPNVGKSTLMNLMLGEKLSIITSKAQTTRHRIHGILNGENFQAVFADTPGILEPGYKLQENMLKAARSALVDADILLFVTDVERKPGLEDYFAKQLGNSRVPVFLIMNKIDLCNQDKLEAMQSDWNQLLPNAIFVPVSARENFNVQNLLKLILDTLPEGPPYYSREDISDKSERFFTAEIIREKILLRYHQEIPYSVEIEIESFKEEDKINRISAVIFVERDSQKAILIGKGGESLKKVGTDSRLELERFFNKKVFLSLHVKVKKNWRNDEKALRDLGYH
jgi:GTP-binding protein Era